MDPSDPKSIDDCLRNVLSSQQDRLHHIWRQLMKEPFAFNQGMGPEALDHLIRFYGEQIGRQLDQKTLQPLPFKVPLPLETALLLRGEEALGQVLLETLRPTDTTQIAHYRLRINALFHEMIRYRCAQETAGYQKNNSGHSPPSK